MIRLLSVISLVCLMLVPAAWAGEKYQVQIKEVDPQTVVTLRIKTTMDQIGPETGHALGRLYAYLGQEGIPPQGPPLSIYYSPPGKKVDFDCCVPVASGVSGEGRIKVWRLAGGPMASLLYVGPYEKIGPAYEAIFGWISQEGYQKAGPCREVYLVGPNETKNPAEYQTEILVPVRK